MIPLRKLCATLSLLTSTTGYALGQGTAAPAGGENTAAEDAGSPASGDSVPAPERKEDGQ